MVVIKEAIDTIMSNEDYSQLELAKELGVTPPTVSTWRNKDNDYCPRLGVARFIWDKFNIQVFPYTKEALANVTNDT